MPNLAATWLGLLAPMAASLRLAKSCPVALDWRNRTTVVAAVAEIALVGWKIDQKVVVLTICRRLFQAFMATTLRTNKELSTYRSVELTPSKRFRPVTTVGWLDSGDVSAEIWLQVRKTQFFGKLTSMIPGDSDLRWTSDKCE